VSAESNGIEKKLEEIKALKDRREVKLLLKYLNDQNETVKIEAAKAIGELGDFSIVLNLIDFLDKDKLKIDILKQLVGKSPKSAPKPLSIPHYCPHCDKEVEYSWDYDRYYCKNCFKLLQKEPVEKFSIEKLKKKIFGEKRSNS
jgi:hypothetical protein